MMNVAVIWSSPNTDGLTASAKDQFILGLTDAGTQVREIHLNRKRIEYCRACGNGWGTCNKKGTCVIQDDFVEVYQTLKEAEETYAELVETTNPTDPVEPRTEAEKGMPGGLIALIVILSLILFTILACIVLFILDRKNILVLSVLHEVFDMIPFFKNKKEEEKK